MSGIKDYVMALASMTQAHVPAEVLKDWLLALKAFASGDRSAASIAARQFTNMPPNTEFQVLILQQDN